MSSPPTSLTAVRTALVCAGAFAASLVGCASEPPTTGGGATEYVFEVRFVGTPPTGVGLSAFTAAANTIRSTIISPLPPVSVPGGFEVGDCDPSDPTLQNLPNQPTGTIQGLVVYVTVHPIDGTGGTLGSAGPCLVRSAGRGGLPALGVLRLDAEDLAAQSGPVLERIILHEMMHVVGFGTIWKNFALLDTTVALDARFLGATARAACISVHLGGADCATTVAVHSAGGPGSAYSHWLEDLFVNELMTPYLDDGATPFSEMTIRSLSDLGYGVSTSAAQGFIVGGAPLRSAALMAGRAAPQRMAEPMSPKFVVEEDGRLSRVRSFE